jgi:ornithine cyclodeaminase/alanine dehydrogenase
VTLLIKHSEIERLLTMKAALPAVEKAFGELEKGSARVPQRETILLPKMKADCFFMPGYLEESKSFGIKLSPYFPDNPKKHALPASVATMVLLDDETGFPLAIMDADHITAIRTGATSGVAAKYLARPDAASVAVIGTGRQAGYQLEAVCAVRDVKQARVTSIDSMQHRLEFAGGMSKRLGLEIEVVDSPEEAVQEADIVLLATTAANPVIESDWIADGAHVSSIQTTGPDHREVDTELVVRSKIVCDSRDACLAEAGELLIPIREGKLSPDDIHASLGELVLGTVPGRDDEREVTFFKTVGLAIEDLAAAKLVYALARQNGLGKQFDFMS